MYFHLKKFISPKKIININNNDTLKMCKSKKLIKKIQIYTNQNTKPIKNLFCYVSSKERSRITPSIQIF